MTDTKLPSPLRGVIPPLVTPLAGYDELDGEALDRLIDHVLAGGVHGLFVLGTTGEGPSLSDRLKREVIVRACTHTAGRAPVLVGITDTSPAESVALARQAADAGAAAVVVAPPPYYAVSQSELLDYLRHIAAESPLPLFLYNMPSHTKLTIEPRTVLAAVDDPAFVGLKDSSGDMRYFHRLQAVLVGRDDFSLFVGPDLLLADAVLLGGHGGVNSGACLRPEWYVALYEAAATSDLQTVGPLLEKVLRITRLVYEVPRPDKSSFLKGLKCALSCEGIINDDTLAAPLGALTPIQRDTIARNLAKLDTD